MFPLSPGGEFLFFGRTNEPGQISDLYWISADVIAHAVPV